MMKTYQFRIKDSGSAGPALGNLAANVNFCWNFCNETQRTALRRASSRIVDGKAYPNSFTAYDFSPLMKGCTKILGLNSSTMQVIAEKYVSSRRMAKRRWLRWRSNKKSLGWIPFKAKAIRVVGNSVIYMKRTFQIWKSREVLGEIVSGSFSQDSRGRWYVNLTVRNGPLPEPAEHGEVGLDLGLKTLVTRSDGVKYGAARYFRRFAHNLGKAQKDGKKRRAKAIYAKVKNSRKDLAHKISHEITRENRLVVVGSVSSSKLSKTRMARSIFDAGWCQLKILLKYKAIARSGIYVEVDEAFTSSTCSRCETKSPPGSPRGLKGLRMREWVCGHCNAIHDRDINAALNILRLGRQSLAPKVA